MNNILGSYLNVLGRRLGQGHQGFPVDASGVRWFSGYLIDESANNFVDESGNRITYVERYLDNPINTPPFTAPGIMSGYLVDESANNFVDQSANKLIYAA